MLSLSMNPVQQSDRLRRVTSPQNALVKALRKSFAEAQADAEGYFAIEGFRIVEEAIRSGLRFKAIVFSDSGVARAEKLIPQMKADVEAVVLDDTTFRSAAPSETPQGVAALVRMPWHELKELLENDDALLLVALGVQDPGNLGTLLRSAEAFGAHGAVTAEQTVSRFNPKVVRAAAGSVFRLPTVALKIEELIAAARMAGLKLMGTSSHKGTALEEARLEGKIAIVIGNEGAGLPASVLKQMDELVTVPHSPKIESLNAGVAGSLILYEAFRQRRGRA